MMPYVRIVIGEGPGEPEVPFDQDFESYDHGHAVAVSRAIAWLSEIVLPHAVTLDHEIHEAGEVPAHGFGIAFKEKGGSSPA